MFPGSLCPDRVNIDDDDDNDIIESHHLVKRNIFSCSDFLTFLSTLQKITLQQNIGFETYAYDSFVKMTKINTTLEFFWSEKRRRFGLNHPEQ